MRSHAAVVPVFALLAIAITWPLALHLDTHVPGEVAGDNLSFLWNFWWMRQALASPAIDFFHTPLLFHPVGVDLVQHTHTALHAWIGATLLGGLSLAAAQNVVLVGAVALAGVGAYLLAWEVTAHRGAAVLAGIVFAAAPFVPARLLGHFNLVSAWGLPFFAFAWLRALHAASPPAAVAYAALAGILLAAVAYTDYYYLIYLLVFTSIAIAVRALKTGNGPPHMPSRTERMSRPWWTSRPWTWIDTAIVVALGVVLAGIVAIGVTGGFSTRIAGVRLSMTSGLNLRSVAWLLLIVGVWRRMRPRRSVTRRADATVGRDLRLAGIVAIVFALAALPLLVRAFDLWQRGEYVSLDIRWRSAPVGIDPLAMVFGNPFHPLTGSASRALYDALAIDPTERVAWFGIAPVALLTAARRRMREQDAATLWILVAGVFFVWALGPYLRIAGAHTGLWLPASLVQHVPLLSNARMPGRALVMVYLAIAMLMAIAIASRRPATPRARTIAALGAAVLIDFAAMPIALYPLDPRPIHRELASLPDGAVCVLPLGLRDGIGERGRFEHRALFDQTIHGKPITGGFVARLPPRLIGAYEHAPVLSSLLELSSGESLNDDELTRDRAAGGEALRRAGIRYVLLYRSSASPQLRDYVATVLPTRLLRADGDIELYTLQ